MIKLNVGPQALVISIQEVFSAPDPNGAVIRAGRKVFTIATKIQTSHIAIVTLEENEKSELFCNHTFNHRICFTSDPLI